MARPDDPDNEDPPGPAGADDESSLLEGAEDRPSRGHPSQRNTKRFLFIASDRTRSVPAETMLERMPKKMQDRIRRARES